jgi:osmotically-inducible protein OsmY
MNSTVTLTAFCSTSTTVGKEHHMNVTTSGLDTSDEQLQQAIEEELEWLPNLNSAHIGVAVDTGTVTLSGHVDSYPEKLVAARAAFAVRGVKSMAQEITVRSVFAVETDDDIAREAAQSLERAVDIPDTVHVSVTAHQITLSGEVEWMFQKEAAGRSMHHIKGVTHVLNEIKINNNALTSGIKEAIVEALLRNAELEGKHIQVATNGGGTITLAGRVRSWAEREQAEKVCWSAPGVVAVVNGLDISEASQSVT